MNTPSKKIYWFLILTFIIFSAAFGTAGYLFYKSQERSLRKEKWDQISAIANLKVKQIENWRAERMEDASMIIESPLIGQHVTQFLRNPEARMLNREIVEWIGSIQRRYHYKKVFLLDEKGDARLSSPEGTEKISSHEKKLTLEAIEKKKVILSDLYRDETTHLIRMSLLVPILLQNGADRRSVGALLLGIDPYRFLYPVVQSWPTPSRTSESMLVRREGEEALLLSELGHREGTALALRFPIKERQIPITMAATSQEGIIEGLDYRGAPVLAAIRVIPNSPWSLIAKVDQKEIYGPIRVRAAFIGSLVAVLILATALSVVLMWRKQHADFQKRKLEGELERRVLAEHLDYLTRYAHDIVLLMDKDLRILEANERAVESYGHSREELLQLSLSDLRAPEVRPVLGCQMRKVEEQNGFVLETLHQRKDGTKFPVENSSRLIEIDGKKFYQSIIRDITERKQAEAFLRKSETELQELFDGAPVGYFEYDHQGRITNVNRTELEMLGYTLEEMIGQPVWKFITEQELARQQILAKLAGTMPPARGLERIYRRKDGTTIPVLIEDRLLKDPQGKVIGIRSTIQGITERKQAEEALQRSEIEAKRLAQENAVIAEIGRIISSTLEIDEVYDRFAEEVQKIIPFDRIVVNLINHKDNLVTIGYVAGIDVSGRRSKDNIPLSGTATEHCMRARSSLIIQGEKKEKVAERLPGLLPTLKAGIRSIIMVPLISKDQVIGALSLRSIEESAYTDEDLRLAENIGAQIAGAIASSQLFSERIRVQKEKEDLQEQLRQSQKMEATGRLAGGIAHDFNNLLTVIEGYCQLLLHELKQDDLLSGNVEEIQKATRRAADLTRQLLAFGRRQILEMKVIDPNRVIQHLEKMLRRIIGEDVELVTLLAEDLGRIKTDQGQIEQVLMNLAVNARDAMPSGGKLTIETANVELDEAYARRHIGVNPGRYVMLSVSDSGVGMIPEVRERVFEPFFTTKERNKGTGLGLSTVYGIVKQSGGNIWVYSESGKGTTFKIYLPRVDEPLEETVEKVRSKELPRGSETVLVAEDEDEVRRLVVRVLERQGYTVLDASDADKALRICKQHQGPIHLLVADVIMPGMSGRELAERLAPLHPEMKVLYMSGYTDNAIVRHGVLEKGINFIQKPFGIEALARKVREVLDRG